MRLWLLGLVASVGCGTTGDDGGAMVSANRSSLTLYSAGVESLPVHPSVRTEFPTVERSCESDTIVDGCRVQIFCVGDTPSAESFSAGTITLMTTPQTVVPAGSWWVTANPFKGGTAIEILGSGAEIPAFDLSVVAPMQATITSRFDMERVPAGEPLVLTWSGNSLGHIIVNGFYGTDGPFNYVRCALDAAPGTGSISRAAMDAFGGGVLRLSSEASLAANVEGWNLDVAVVLDAIWEDGTFAQGVPHFD